MSSMSRRKEGSRSKIKSMGDHKEFLKRITKTLYYGQLPTLPCLSLPVTEISCEMWSEAQRGRSLRRLHGDAAASIARQACVSPCALVLALLYLERLNTCNPDYIAAASPADLFLVSLMVGNKFLQDDGEDDDVMCSEWAASGGIELKQLKKLEVEFLDAIDWNIFVSEKSFEDGLEWLERQVALRQAQLRGFFTYTDLVATCDSRLFADVLQAVSFAWVSLTFGYLSTLMTVVTSTLVMSHAWLPTLQLLASRSSSPSVVDTNLITSDSNQPNILNPMYLNNDTLDNMLSFQTENEFNTETITCCTKWMQHREAVSSKKNWYETNIIQLNFNFESWWSKISVLNWLYQSSLISPVQRWLERINEYADFIGNEFGITNSRTNDPVCNTYKKPGARQRCVQQWLNFSKLSRFAAILVDR